MGNFECIYSDEVCLVSMVRCKKCGTVIECKDDEDYEPNFECPTCTKYNTHYRFWTKEQIENDLELQQYIDFCSFLGHIFENSVVEIDDNTLVEGKPKVKELKNIDSNKDNYKDIKTKKLKR